MNPMPEHQDIWTRQQWSLEGQQKCSQIPGSKIGVTTNVQL